MKPKIIATSILRRLLIIFGVVISFIAFCACENGKSSSGHNFSGIYASDVSVVYDGNPHSISVTNTLETDSVVFSADGKVYSATPPAFVLPGEYTVYFKVNRSGYKEFSSSATVTILPCILSDISAENISVVYDGRPHSIIIEGLLPSDTVLYSTDGITFSSEPPSFTDVDVYSIYYRVERDYGYYNSSCILNILPAVYGRYFNKTYGVVEISTRTDTVDPDGLSGFIGDEPFSVTDDVLTYKDMSFMRLSDSDRVYKLIVAHNTIYFCADSSGELSVSFADGTAVIKLGQEVIMSVPDYNYCESGVVTDYIDLCFEQAFEYADEITEVTVSLSNRDINPISFDRQFVTYDGEAHGFEFSESIEYLSEQTTFTDVGRHTVSVVVISDEYLPRVIDCTLVILPNLTGLYASSEHVIQIADGAVKFDGVSSGKLSVVGDDWAWNNKPITATSDGIMYDDVTYAATTDIMLVVRLNNETYGVVRLPQDVDQLEITYNGETLTFAPEDKTLLEIPLSVDHVNISFNGTTLPSRVHNGIDTFMLGRADIISEPVILIEIKTS